MKNTGRTHIKKTEDGSPTLYSEQFRQYYHNPGGAVSESKHVFFENNGLSDALKTKEQINILEIGFGTGLNLLVLNEYYLNVKSRAKINYHAIEANPISPETFAKLNYNRYSKAFENLKPFFSSLKEGCNNFSFKQNIFLNVFYGPFANYTPGGLTFDFIFHDAFSPRVNPELWTGVVFKKLLNWSNPTAILSTYCAASKVRGAMTFAGWNVARAPGALKKREMTVASPTADKLKSFKRVNEKHLAERFKQDDF
ncbi:MAG TPA: tRNA (5-methylaminomethyl-2-thiouridine)(34)-methyltransferase MnmD [Balneolaceae bacterium]|nr:tRNA (5-methylaminomethyl-2-thiouridine)(34)-methyltransferase MnmD [Balneolaceae bacterium]